MEFFQNVGWPTEIFWEMFESKSRVWQTAIKTVETKVRRLSEAGQPESSAYIDAHVVKMSNAHHFIPVLLKTAWKRQSRKLACLLYSSEFDLRRHEQTDVQKESTLEEEEEEWLVDS